MAFAGRQVISQTLLLLLYVKMSAEILHFRLVASWLNCKHTWESNSFMTMSLKSDGRPGEAELNGEANTHRELNQRTLVHYEFPDSRLKGHTQQTVAIDNRGSFRDCCFGWHSENKVGLRNAREQKEWVREK